MSSLLGAVPVELFNPVTLLIFIMLFVMSLIAVSVGIFKTLQFRRMGVGHRNAGEKMLQNWLSGQPDRALLEAKARKSVLARVLEAVFTGLQSKPNDPSYAEELGRQSAIIELARMSDRMRLLEMVVQAAPMLGLLGTVVGMIDAFAALSQSSGAVDPAALAGGIWSALTTTATGLMIALVAYFVATWLEGRIERERNLMETIISAAIHGRVDHGTSNAKAG